MCANNTWLNRAKHSFIALAFLCPAPVSAQLITNFQSFRGTTLSVDGTLGVRCNSDSGALPAIFGSAGQTGGTSSSNNSSNTRAIVGFVVPIRPGGYGDCNKILSYEEAAARLQLATTLLETGTITPEQYNKIALEVYQIISTKK